MLCCRDVAQGRKQVPYGIVAAGEDRRFRPLPWRRRSSNTAPAESPGRAACLGREASKALSESYLGRKAHPTPAGSTPERRRPKCHRLGALRRFRRISHGSLPFLEAVAELCRANNASNTV